MFVLYHINLSNTNSPLLFCELWCIILLVIKAKQTEEKINEVLNNIRPYLNHDGGDVEFINFKDGICYVKLKGACAGCMFADMTINNTVEEILTTEVPEVIKVQNIEEV